jgi:hypothetical protein
MLRWRFRGTCRNSGEYVSCPRILLLSPYSSVLKALVVGTITGAVAKEADDEATRDVTLRATMMKFSLRKFLLVWPLTLFIVGISYAFITLPRADYVIQMKWIVTYLVLSVVMALVFAIDFRDSGGNSGDPPS